jgi:hypothetical protein
MQMLAFLPADCERRQKEFKRIRQRWTRDEGGCYYKRDESAHGFTPTAPSTNQYW